MVSRYSIVPVLVFDQLLRDALSGRVPGLAGIQQAISKTSNRCCKRDRTDQNCNRAASRSEYSAGCPDQPAAGISKCTTDREGFGQESQHK